MLGDKDGAGVNSAKFFDDAYEKHITAFENGETYQYILYFKAENGYYFTADTKIKINGTLYSYRLVNIDPNYDSTGRMYTFWAYTDLTMTPQTSGTTPEYKITEGANGSWLRNSDGALKFVANGDFANFTGIAVELLSAQQQSVKRKNTPQNKQSRQVISNDEAHHSISLIFTH